MFDLFKKLLFSRQISFEQGEITLLHKNIFMVPADTLINLQKKLEKIKMEHLLYLASKSSGEMFMKSVQKKFSMNLRDTVKWSFNIVNLAGYGDGELVVFKPEKCYTVIRLFKSNYAKNYGKSDYAIDVIYRGFIAGMGVIAYKENAETVEVKCISKGDKFCEFICRAENKWNLSDKIVKKQLGAVIGRKR